MKNLFDMSTEDLINLKNKIEMLLENRTENDTILFYNSVRKKMQELGILLPPFYAIKDKKLIAKINNFIVNVKIQYKINSSNITEIAFIFAELMFDFLRENEIPVSTKTLFENTDKFFSLMDNAFPNYHKIFFKIRDYLDKEKKI